MVLHLKEYVKKESKVAKLSLYFLYQPIAFIPSIKSWYVATLWYFTFAVEMELNNFSAQSILARSMADKSIDDIEP